MKKNLVVVTVALVSLLLGYFIGSVKESVGEKFAIIDNEVSMLDSSKNLKETRIANGDKEVFNDFLARFISDSLFQLGRVKFPLKSQQWNSGEVDSARIEKNNWKMVRLYWGEEYIPQIYDNFKREMRDTDERLFCWEGIDNGINVEYRFNRIKGKWYMTEFSDFSD
ncbi:MAG: DUF4348 domain-containing protein [Cyclobacteriaceae bacterium]|nr:DUF4348 domain-containing protein [Cyclobacteriaceae bacterium]